MEKGESLYLDLHIHSSYSKDSLQSPEKIIEMSLKKGLSVIAIVDHDSISGGLKAREINKSNLEIIVGLEVKTEFGDVIGLFLEKGIQTKNFFELVSEIKKQDGLVMLPHPYKKHKLEKRFLEKVDLLEVYNSRLKQSLNIKALNLSKELSLPQVSGSDAHFPWEIGRGRMKIKKPLNPLDLKKILLSEEREFIVKQTGFFWELASQCVKYLKKSQIL
ncbi:MAG: PHP domain-containing protein [candidate division Zixibacteria bacterium]|nr:PHP domain-containing protein [candidate division Zixibacteria bacterium]